MYSPPTPHAPPPTMIIQVPIYTEVKKAAETQHGVMTQCVARDNVRKCNFMTNINISMKVYHDVYMCVYICMCVYVCGVCVFCLFPSTDPPPRQKTYDRPTSHTNTTTLNQPKKQVNEKLGGVNSIVAKEQVHTHTHTHTHKVPSIHPRNHHLPHPAQTRPTQTKT